MTSPTSKLRTHWRVCAAMGLATILLLGAPPLADAQVIQGVEKGAREGNKAAGPVGGVLGGAIGGVVGVVTGVTGVLTGGNNNNNAKGGQALVTGLYLMILSRLPTDEEAKIVNDYAQASRGRLREASVDLAWALVNSTEFLYRH